MAYPIKFLSLQKPELEYEVAIRGETPGNTVADLRKQISKLCQQFPSEDIMSSYLDSSDDLDTVLDLLNKISLTLESKINDKNTLSRIESMLNHVYHRLNRIEADESILKQHDKCTKMFRDCYTNLLQLKKNSTDPLSVDISTSLANSQVPVNISVTCDKNKASEISKLKFDGKSCVRSFIQRINEFSESREMSDSKLLSFATEIFTDEALHWFRSVKNQVASWEELIVLLKQDFDKPDYDYRLLSEIRSRTQGETENITIYLSILSGMFARLSRPLSEDDKLEIVLHNIRPYYASTLASATEIKDINQVRTLCRNFENVQSRLSHFREPSAVTPDTLAPEFAYKGNRAKTQFNFKSNTLPLSNNQPFVNPKSFTSKNVNEKYLHSIEKDDLASSSKLPYCPRCREHTHSLRACKNMDIMCFKCGMKGVKKPDCPKCNIAQTPKN